MRKKIVKLVLGLSVLAGALAAGVAPKAANAAAGTCPTYCCDPNCLSIRPCFRVGASCICREFCEPNGGGSLN